MVEKVIEPGSPPKLSGHTLYGRPMAFAKGNRGPYGLPYLNNGPLPLAANWMPDWHGFVSAEECFFKRLCMYCGNRMTGPVILVRYRSDSYLTSGPGLHPTCALYATRSCPHIANDPYIKQDGDVLAYVVVGEVGIEPIVNEDGTLDMELTFQDGINDVVRHAIPITNPQLRQLARECPER